MRFIKISATLAVLAVFMGFGALTLAAADGQNHRTLEITIEVECVETAVQTIRDLPGFTTHSNAQFSEWGATANFDRRVAEADLPQTLAVLRSLGEVRFESEWTSHLGAEAQDLQARLRANDMEIARLNEMMTRAANLTVMFDIEGRLGNVMRHSDNMRARLNTINDMTSMPYIGISIWDAPAAEHAAPAAFSQRLGDTFINSAIQWANLAGNAVVFVVWIIIPLGLVAAIALPTWLIVRKLLKKSKAKKEGGLS